ncbi:MAG: WcbI family polysaccharide biosynthesis putative acetyltransferase, partial [Cyanobium sp. LacPavin_0920_WC12_MAG_62_9]|nr:WcbI family polysaccharide biosynthesis putative acetyltransferase [Cyanobium sp. LacPavin_0920_WC12_MAG_62_9]
MHLATAAEVARLHQALPKADVLVMHRVQPGYRNNIGLDSTTLKSLLSPSARCLVLPNLHYEGQLPWCGYGQDPDGRLAALEADSPLGPYQDFLAMAAAGLGLDAEDLLNQSCPEGVAALLQIAHQSSLAELQSREAQCNVQLSDWIAEHHRHQPIGHTINHPTQASLRELLRRLIGQLDPENRLGPDPFDGQDHLDSLSLPIHPWVQQALNLGAWSTSWGQRENIPFSIQAQLAESIAFYRLHPWIAAANADHPKLTFAKHCLGFLPKVSNETGSRQADHANKAASDSTT